MTVTEKVLKGSLNERTDNKIAKLVFNLDKETTLKSTSYLGLGTRLRQNWDILFKSQNLF